MDQKRANEIQREINAETDPAKKLAMLESAITEAMEDGASLPFAQVEALCDFATKAVKVAIQEIIDVAEQLGSPVVPVMVLQEVLKFQPTAVKALMKTIDRFGIEVTCDVPDDISELEGL